MAELYKRWSAMQEVNDPVAAYSRAHEKPNTATLAKP
jgi:hypothetical protein